MGGLVAGVAETRRERSATKSTVGLQPVAAEDSRYLVGLVASVDKALGQIRQFCHGLDPERVANALQTEFALGITGEIDFSSPEATTPRPMIGKEQASTPRQKPPATVAARPKTVKNHRQSTRAPGGSGWIIERK